VAQARKRREISTKERTSRLAARASTGASAPDLCGSEGRAQAPAAGVGRPEPISGAQSRRRVGGDVDLTSAGGLCPRRAALQDDELSRVDQCLSGRAVCQGGSVDEFPSAAVGYCVTGYRAPASQSEGLSVLTPLA